MDILRINKQFQLFGGDVRLDDGTQIVDQVRQMCLRFFDPHFSAFDLAHIQYIVDQREQMLTGNSNFAEIILNLFLIVDMGSSKRREADNSVHRRTDIMGHIIQEGRFGTVCLLGSCQSLRQRFPVFFQLPVFCLQFFAGSFFFFDLFFRSSPVPVKEIYDHKRYRKSERSEKRHVFPYKIKDRHRIQLFRIAVSKILYIIAADNADTAVQQPQQSFVADFHTERPVVILTQLNEG